MTERLNPYPLTVSWSAGSALAGIFLAVASDNFISGFAIFVLGAGIGLTWRRGEAPIFPFVITYQWVAITIGFWYERVVGHFPSSYPPGDINATVTWALAGLAVLAVGIRLATTLVDKFQAARGMASAEQWEIRNLKALFFIVMGAYTVDFLIVLNPKAFPDFAVFLERALDLRQVLLLVLWYEVLRSRSGYAYLWMSLAWVFVPRLGAYFSDFKSPLILLAIVMASTWRPWEQFWWRRGFTTLIRATPVIALLIVSVLIWQAGVKRETRRAHDLDIVGQRPTERIELFLSSAKNALPTLIEDTPEVIEGLVERLSYITFFSLVLDRVPDREPFAGGELLKMAVINSTVPRFLFPEKPELPSDSYYTRRFAGVQVSEGMTSISIGYMAEFYVDWGFQGMLFAVFCFGCWIGVASAAVRRLSGPAIFVNAVMIMVFLRVSEFETQFVKSLAAMNMSLVVNLVMLALARPFVTRVIDLRPISDTRIDAPVRVAAPVSPAPSL